MSHFFWPFLISPPPVTKCHTSSEPPPPQRMSHFQVSKKIPKLIHVWFIILTTFFAQLTVFHVWFSIWRTFFVQLTVFFMYYLLFYDFSYSTHCFFMFELVFWQKIAQLINNNCLSFSMHYKIHQVWRHTCAYPPSVTNCHTFSDPLPPPAWYTLWTAPNNNSMINM